MYSRTCSTPNPRATWLEVIAFWEAGFCKFLQIRDVSSVFRVKVDKRLHPHRTKTCTLNLLRSAMNMCVCAFYQNESRTNVKVRHLMQSFELVFLVRIGFTLEQMGNM